MYAEIRAWDVTESYDRRGVGKSMWVNKDDFKVSVSRETAKHLDNPPWHLAIEASFEEQRGAEAGKYIQRELKLELTPKDIERIVQVALDNSLLRLPKVKATNGRK